MRTIQRDDVIIINIHFSFKFDHYLNLSTKNQETELKKLVKNFCTLIQKPVPKIQVYVDEIHDAPPAEFNAKVELCMTISEELPLSTALWLHTLSYNYMMTCWSEFGQRLVYRISLSIPDEE